MMPSVILRAATRVLIGLMLLFAVFMLVRGHDAPGGGFIAGLIATTAFGLHALAFGTRALRRLVGVDPRAITAVGLAAALAAGLIGGLAGRPFLAGAWLLLGDELALGTPLLFDAGVGLVVVGTLLTLLSIFDEDEA